MALTYHLLDSYDKRFVPESWSFGLDEHSQGLRLASQPTGLDGALFKHMRQKNARQAGASWVGMDRDINSITLDVHVGPFDSAEEAVDTHARWRNTVGDGSKVSEFHVIDDSDANPLHVWLPVRMSKLVGESSQVQIAEDWYAREQVTFESDTSFWQGFPVKKSFRVSEVANASLLNRSDVPVYPRYRVYGPGQFTIGTANEYLALQMLTATQCFDINTDPDDAYIRDEKGADAWDRIGVRAWYEPVEDRGVVPFHIEVVNHFQHANTRAEIELPQLFSRAGHVPLPTLATPGGSA